MIRLRPLFFALLCFASVASALPKGDPTPPGVPGVAVDKNGGAVIDPTENVKALTAAAVVRLDDIRAVESRRVDDLRTAYQLLTDEKLAHLRDVDEIREKYQKEISEKEGGRLDSIRQVDREEVAKTAAAANTAIATLAKQTNDLAVTLAKQVTDTAVAAEARNTAQYNDTNKRLSALELNSSEIRGKQQISDPAIIRLTEVVERLASVQAVGAGKTEGIGTSWGVIIAVIGAGGVLVSIAVVGVGLVVFVMKRSAFKRS